MSELLGFAVWLVFGLAALPLIRDQIGWRELLFAVLSLTVFRMVPVAVSLIGTGMRARSVAFIGWFGPRGLASVVFALLAVEDLDVDDSLRDGDRDPGHDGAAQRDSARPDRRRVRRAVRRLDRPDPPADRDRTRHRTPPSPVTGAVAAAPLLTRPESSPDNIVARARDGRSRRRADQPRRRHTHRCVTWCGGGRTDDSHDRQLSMPKCDVPGLEIPWNRIRRNAIRRNIAGDRFGPISIEER